VIVEITVTIGLFLFAFYLGYFLLMRRKSSEGDSWSIPCETDFAPSVSVIVPAYNEENTIVHKLRNLLEQGYPNMEIIVVDDGSNDDTTKMVQSFIDRNSSKFRVRLVVLPKRKGKASALNYAWQHCNGEIVIISDAETTLGETAIKNLVQNFCDQKVGAVTGRLSMVNYEQTSATKLEKSYRNVFDMLRLGESHMDSTPIFNGPLVALRKNLFDHLESDTIADDTEISLTIREKGYRAIFDPRATVYAFTPKSFKFRMKQKIRRAQGIIQSLHRHRKILFNPAYGKYGTIILPCEFFMHVISPLLLVLISILSLFILVYNSIILMYFMVIFGLVIIIYGLTFVALRRTSKDRTPINLIEMFATFLEHQTFLMLGLLLLSVRKKNVRWEKIKD